MRWSAYLAFLAIAAVVLIIPGPDLAVVFKNTMAAGWRRGRWAAAGVASAAAVQGTLAVAGLGSLVVHAQPAFQALKWAGAGYLAFLGLQAWRSAARADHRPPEGGLPPPGEGSARAGRRAAVGGWRQGFASNVTNPKVLVFYLAVLPQFLRPGTAPGWLLVLAWSHAALSLAYLAAVSAAMARVRGVLSRRRVRRAVDGLTGAALLGFSAALAAGQP